MILDARCSAEPIAFSPTDFLAIYPARIPIIRAATAAKMVVMIGFMGKTPPQCLNDFNETSVRTYVYGNRRRTFYGQEEISGHNSVRRLYQRGNNVKNISIKRITY